MKFVIACQKIEVTGVLPTCEVVGMTLWPKIKWVVAHTFKKRVVFKQKRNSRYGIFGICTEKNHTRVIGQV